MSLRVADTTKNATIVERGRVADNHWTRLKGLIGVKELTPGDGLAIIPCKSIHCMFMSIPIDVLYVSEDHRVVGIDAEIKPWRIGRFYKDVHYVIELPAGTAARLGVDVGDQLSIDL